MPYRISYQLVCSEMPFIYNKIIKLYISFACSIVRAYDLSSVCIKCLARAHTHRVAVKETNRKYIYLSLRLSKLVWCLRALSAIVYLFKKRFIALSHSTQNKTTTTRKSCKKFVQLGLRPAYRRYNNDVLTTSAKEKKSVWNKNIVSRFIRLFTLYSEFGGFLLSLCQTHK